MELDASRGQFMSGAGNRGLVYNTKVTVQGDYDPDIRYGVAEVYEWDDANQLRRTRRPSADNLPWQNLAVLPGTTPARASDKVISAAMFEMDTRPVLVSVASDSPDPEIGSTLGTVAGSWALKVGNTGFICTGISIDEGSGGTRLVYVRPTGGGGGGGSFAIVQATADGADGVVTAKAISLLADPALHPNFEQTGDPLSLRYFTT